MMKGESKVGKSVCSSDCCVVLKGSWLLESWGNWVWKLKRSLNRLMKIPGRGREKESLMELKDYLALNIDVCLFSLLLWEIDFKALKSGMDVVWMNWLMMDELLGRRRKCSRKIKA